MFNASAALSGSFARAIGRGKIPFVYAENPGAHEWKYWDTHLRDALSFLMLHLGAPEKEAQK